MESSRQPKDEAPVQEESTEAGEGAGRFPQSVGELRGDVGSRRNRWDIPLKNKRRDNGNTTED